MKKNDLHDLGKRMISGCYGPGFRNRVRVQGPVVQSWISANPGLNLTCCFSLCISAHLFVSKLQRRKLSFVQTIFLKKYFQVHSQAVGKFALNFRLT